MRASADAKQACCPSPLRRHLSAPPSLKAEARSPVAIGYWRALLLIQVRVTTARTPALGPAVTSCTGGRATAFGHVGRGLKRSGQNADSVRSDSAVLIFKPHTGATEISRVRVGAISSGHLVLPRTRSAQRHERKVGPTARRALNYGVPPTAQVLRPRTE